MATIEKRGNSYRITVSCGVDITGKQQRRRMTYTPDPGMTKRQIEKEVQRQAVLFEEECQKGHVLNGNIKLVDFIEIFFTDYAAAKLKKKTIEDYRQLTPYVNQALGHLRIDRIQPMQLNAFYRQLQEVGTQYKCVYKPLIDLKELIKRSGISVAQAARECGVKENTLRGAVKGDNVQEETAKAICRRFKLNLKKDFEKTSRNKPLSPVTIRHYHRFISTVLNVAVKWQLILYNPCQRATPPKIEKTPPKYLDEEQAARLLGYLETEEMQNKTMIKLFIYTGMRRGEACGLEWKDINFKTSVITVRRNSQYIIKQGIVTDSTKTATSERSIKASKSCIDMLKDYKIWQEERARLMGDRWNYTDRLFTKADGSPIHPDTITCWFRDFLQKHSDDLPKITIHSLRHTNATLMINQGIPITTIAARLGHSTPSTTTTIYAHSVKSMDAAAADTLEFILNKGKGSTEQIQIKKNA